MMEINSQVCTDIDQSKKLIKLGLKSETADLFYTFDYTIGEIGGINILTDINKLEDLDIPAWSLHRLIKICSDNYISFHLNLKNDSLYDEIILLVEQLIKANKINKDYLTY